MQRETISTVYFGLTDTTPQGSARVRFGPDTVNFYPDEEGYLTNYAGKTDYLKRVDPMDSVPYRGDPPALAPITRVFYFRDAFEGEHIVFVQGDELRELWGNGYRTLYTFIGESVGNFYYPDLFLYQAKLIIVNFGDPVLVFNGVIMPHPVGILEVPQPPEPRNEYIPGTVDDFPYGVLAWRNIWWPGRNPASGPSQNADADGDPIPGLYMVRLQYVDIYGNKSRLGPPCAPTWVEPIQTFTPSSPYDTKTYTYYNYLVFDWIPPSQDEHIAGVYVCRTPNLEKDDPQGGSSAYETFYYERYYDGTALSRHTCQLTDTLMIENGEVDYLAAPPLSAHMGCAWNGRIFLWGHEDDHVVTISDVDKFGQFRDSYRMRGPVRAGIPLNDRIVFVSENSTEVLFDNNGTIGTLEQNFSMGSRHGRSFVDVGGSVFGLWRQGFGFYGFFDGEYKHQFVKAPYWLERMYVSARLYVTSSLKMGNWYKVAFSLYSTSDTSNYVAMFHLQTQEWYLIEETVRDMTDMNGVVLGCDDSIYELFKGTYPESTLHIRDLFPDQSSSFSSRPLTEHRLLMEPSSSLSLEGLTVEADWTDLSSEFRSGVLMPTNTSINRSSTLRAYWDHATLLYTDEPLWTSPGDFIFTPEMSQPVTGYAHKIHWNFPAGARIRIKAMALSWGSDQRSDY